MMNNLSQVIALVEDEHHEMLIRRYLKRCGLNKHQMRMRRCPSGRGAAESWVRKQFPEEIKQYRRRQAKALTGLVVMIDADAHTVRERLGHLEQALTASSQEPVGKYERVARLVPRRNVETWILCLTDRYNLDEEADYTQEINDWHESLLAAAETLSKWTQSKTEPPPHCVNSLRNGVEEQRRLGQ